MSIATRMKRVREISEAIWNVRAFNWMLVIFTVLIFVLSLYKLWAVRGELLEIFAVVYLLRLAVKNLWRLYEIEEKGQGETENKDKENR